MRRICCCSVNARRKTRFERVSGGHCDHSACSSADQLYFFPHIGLCGASGVVFAFILLASFTGFEEGEIPLTFILVAAIFIGQQVYEGIAIRDNISHMGHIVGGILGAVSGYGLNKKSRSGV